MRRRKPQPVVAPPNPSVTAIIAGIVDAAPRDFATQLDIATAIRMGSR